MSRLQHILTTTCCWLSVATAWAQAPSSVMDQIPHDARGFAILLNVESTIDKVETLAARFEMPAPPLGPMLDDVVGLNKEHHVGVAWLDQRDGDDPQTAYTHFVVYLPVSDYNTFIGQFEAADPTSKIIAASFNNQEFLVAKKGDFAILADVEEQASLEHVLESKKSIAEISKPLQEWIKQNDLSIALSPSGTKLMFAKLKEGLELVKAGATAAADENSQMIESALDIYKSLFDAGEKEVTQLAVGLRIDPEKSIELHKRVLLAEDGWLTKASTNLKRPERPLAGLPAGPFVVAFDGALPQEWPQGLMAMSFDMLKSMQGPDAETLTDEQVQKLGAVGAKTMQGVRSMSFAMGVGGDEGGIYDRTAGILRVDDSKAFMKSYEDSISEMVKLMEGSPLAGAYEVSKEQIEGISVLHLTTDMSKFQFGGLEGLVDMNEYYEKMFGEGGKLSIYLAPADDSAVVMAYTSGDNLLNTIRALRAGTESLADDAELKKTATTLPASAQWIGYVSPGGIMQFASQMASTFAPDPELKLADFPVSPPIGFAAELNSAHMDVQLVVPLETLDAVKEFAAQMQQ